MAGARVTMIAWVRRFISSQWPQRARRRKGKQRISTLNHLFPSACTATAVVPLCCACVSLLQGCLPHTHTHTAQDGPDHQTALNLVLCAVAAGDADLMRQSFVELLQV